MPPKKFKTIVNAIQATFALSNRHRQPTTDQIRSSNPGTVYALTIGINEYENQTWSTLQGAVTDADAMEDWIKKALGASPDNIISLRGSQARQSHQKPATRQDILDAFKRLEFITRDTVEPCILIFYAGHGASVAVPPGWDKYVTDGEDIEVICPSDMGMEIKGGEGAVVEGIPDKRICEFLNDLSEKVGNNITLILDCCCSAGLDRRGPPGNGKSIPRWIANPPPITVKANPPILPSSFSRSAEASVRKESSRGAHVAHGFAEKFDGSHTLLAACGRRAVAYELPVSKNDLQLRGVFSAALLKFVTKCPRLETETYLTLIHSLCMPHWQTPHCIGANINRPLFNRRRGRSDSSYIDCNVTYPNDESVVTMFAGSVQGIKPGELFAIYDRLPLEGEVAPCPLISSMRVGSVDVSTSNLQFPESGPSNLSNIKVVYARSLDWRSDGPVLIYCEDPTLKPLISVPVGSNKNQLVVIKFTSDSSKASLILRTEGENVYIERNDQLINRYIPRRFPHTFKRTEPKDIITIIGAWRQFNYHLNRYGPNDYPDVRMELQVLKNGKPVGADLLKNDPAEIEVPDHEISKLEVGMTLYNSNQENDVFPYLFYFDPLELTIDPWFIAAQGPSTGRVDSPLPGGSKLPLGYGNGGVRPWEFYIDIDSGRTHDIGFFKLFLSNSPANFSSLVQPESPFKYLGSSERGGVDLSAEPEQPEELSKAWGAKMATVISFREQ